MVKLLRLSEDEQFFLASLLRGAIRDGKSKKEYTEVLAEKLGVRWILILADKMEIEFKKIEFKKQEK